MLHRDIAPAVTPLTIPELLPYRRLELPNGIEVICMNDPNQEVFKMDVLFEAGIYYQPQPLIASTAINMLNEGTERHTAEQIADLFDYYGAYVDFNCGLHKSEVSLFSLKKYAAETIGMLAEMIRDSRIPEKELEIYLANTHQEFLVNNEKTSYLARKEFSALFFGSAHPYANQVSENDFNRVSPALLQDFYHRYINAQHCRIMLCGNVDNQILQIVADHFSPIPRPALFHEVPSRSFSPAPAGRYHVEKENAVQTSLRIGKSGVRLPDEDYAGFMLLNTVLGGYFGSRLMSNIREEKGYTYGISSFNVSMPLNSYWCIATEVNQEYSSATIDEVFKEIRRLQTEPIPTEELTLVKNFLHGDLLREVDGVFAQSDTLKNKLNYGFDNNIYAEIIEKIKQYTAEDLLLLANKYWQTEEMYIVTAGK